MSAGRLMTALAAILIAGLAIGTDLAAQTSQSAAPPAQPSQPQANTEESPFGGPPPMKRGKRGVKCRTPQGICAVEPAQPLGDPCSCPGTTTGPVQGKIE